MIKKSKVIGILGGMGPFATAEFFKKIIDLTPAQKDWEHLRIIIDNNPHIPSRTKHYLYNEESPVKGMIESCRRLSDYPVDLIAIPCNSACFFLPQIQPYIKIPILNIIEVASEALALKYPIVKKCAVIGGRITYAEETYKKPLLKHEITYVEHSNDLQIKVEKTIETIKQGIDLTTAENLFNEIVDDFIKTYQINALILGCTEFGCIFDEKEKQHLPIIDSSYELASYLVKISLESQP